MLLVELNFEVGLAIVSLLTVVGSSLGMLCDPGSPPGAVRVLDIESPRLRPAPGCALHRLVTLSERFIIAL